MKTRLLCPLISLVLVCLLPCKLQAQERVLPVVADSLAAVAQEVQENPLFTDEEVLHFKLSMDMKEVLKDRGDDRGYHPAVISYQDVDGHVVTEELKVRVRGNRRRDPEVCRFPPLLLNFKRSTVQHTVFGKVNKVKVVTHCIGDDYVLREYLVYKLYNIVTDTSFRVRFCMITYVDTRNNKKPETGYAFLIEDEDDMAARSGAMIVPEEAVIRMDRTDSVAMAKLALFQYMIGNTDWSVPYRHNIIVLSTNHLLPPVAVPFDFDYAGIVNAPYAQPPPEFGLASVRERLYRGYSFTDDVYRSIIDFYNENKSKIYSVYQENNLLDKRTKKYCIKYLDKFYDTLNDPKDFQKKIVRIGEQNDKNKYVLKDFRK